MNQNKFRAAVALVLSLMMVSTVVFSVMVTALFTISPAYAAPPQILATGDYLPMIAFEDNDLKIFGFKDIPQVIDTHLSALISNHVWSPDGNWLVYIRTGIEGNELMLTDVFGRPPQVIATGLNSGLPIQFSIDNKQVFYAVVPNPEQATNSNDLYTVDVMTFVMGSPNSPIKLGSFEQASCDGSESSIYDMLYWAEAGTNGIRPILTVTKFGIVHSTTCGGAGVALLNLTTRVDTVLDNDITNVALSADEQTLLGIKGQQIMVIDVETGQKTNFIVDGTPDQVMWGALNTSNIYYTVRTVTDETVNYTADEQEKILSMMGVQASSVPVTHVSIHRFNLETNNDEIVYDNIAYAIGHMTLLPDNRVLMVSEVPSLIDWFDMILESDNSKPPQLKTALYLVSLEGAETRLLGVGLTGARLNDDEYVRQFGLRPALTAQPTTVSIETQIKLTGTNFPPQSRVLVYLGADANNLDDIAYAAGFTNAQGEISLAFNLPAKRDSGQSIGNSQMVLVAKSSDGLFSAQAGITVNINTSPPPIVPVIPTVPSVPSAPRPVFPASISISPDNGTIGTQININGRNFPANKRVNIHLGSITNVVGNPVYAAAFSDNNGNVSLTFNMPGVYANGSQIQSSQVLIVAATDNFGSSSALFFNFTPITQPVVIPSISLSPTSVKVRNAITVAGSNFPPNKMINLLMGPNANDLRGNYRTVTTDGNGKFETSFTMPEYWRHGNKIKVKQVVIVGAPYPSGTWSNPVTLGIEERKRNNNKPTPTPTEIISENPTVVPTDEPTEVPTDEPTEVPTDEPTEVPTDEPTAVPTELPTDVPVELPTDEPTAVPTEVPTDEPTEVPTEVPTELPTDEPTVQEPVVQITPNSVFISGFVKVSGTHFPVNTVLTVRLVGEVSTALGVVTTDGNGSFVGDYIVPAQIEDMQVLPAGLYKMVVGTADISAQTTITILG